MNDEEFKKKLESILTSLEKVDNEVKKHLHREEPGIKIIPPQKADGHKPTTDEKNKK